MKKIKKVVCVYAIVVSVSGEDIEASVALNGFSDRAFAGLVSELGADCDVELQKSVSYIWVDGLSENVFRCRTCNRYFSATNREKMIPGLPEGVYDEIVCQCDECLQI